MERLTELYDLLAGLFTYPLTPAPLPRGERGESYTERLGRCQELAAADFPEAAGWLGRFAERIGPLTGPELEELFIGTFDLNPACAPEVGWHLFGENYERGEFLVLMRGHLRRLGLAESVELPDHLAHVLRVLGRLPQAEADRLLSRAVLPALEKMPAALSGRDNPFALLLEAVRCVLLSPAAVALPEVTRG